MSVQPADIARKARLLEEGLPEQRDGFRHDKDRILYSSAFRRLSGVTQIVRAGEEDIFHNRLTHSMKVAQVGRRIAEKLLRDDLGGALSGTLNTDVVEAACLAHDLGHPPFGHCGEKTLDRLVRLEASLPSDLAAAAPADEGGFEGNAQSFRILTKLSVRWPEKDGVPFEGLDLTRASLAACLKYPWISTDARAGKGKWGAYPTEEKIFGWVREPWPEHYKTLEAQIMDWADDITYSVHDLEDFHRCGVIPWKELFFHMNPKGGQWSEISDRLLKDALKKWEKEAGDATPADAYARLVKARLSIADSLQLYPDIWNGKYEGTRAQRQQIRSLSSLWVGEFMENTSVTQDGDLPALRLDADAEEVVRLLKAVTVSYIISSPSLHAQQLGQSRIIEDLFVFIVRALVQPKSDGWLPRRFGDIVQMFRSKAISARRAASDCICSMTENEAVALRSRIMGVDAGSVLNPLVR